MTKIIIASGPVIVENNRVLLNQHGDTNFWKFCGGRVEDYDLSLIEVARREVQEEMGIGIEILNLEPFVLHTLKNTDAGQIDVLLVHFLAKRQGDINPGADIRAWQWLPIDDLKNQDLAPNIIPTLKHFGFIE